MTHAMAIKEKREKVETNLTRMAPQLAKVLGRSIPAERYARICLSMVATTPKLLDCTPQSFYGSIMECATLGLEPGVNGDAWIIPYKTTATLVIGYKGLVRLAYRSGQIRAISAACVYEGDEFSWRLGTDAGIHHVPTSTNRDPDRITHAYCVIQTDLGGTVFEVLTRDEIDDVRRRSRAGGSGPWVTDFPAMAKKTAVRRAAKLAPSSTQFARAVDLDERAEAGRPQELDFDVDSAEPEREEPFGRSHGRPSDSEEPFGEDVEIPK